MKTNRYLMLAGMLILAFGLTSSLEAQDPVLEYETVIPGYYLSSGDCIVADESGNAYGIASYYEDMQHVDILVFKLDAGGTLQWSLPIVGDDLEHDIATDITLDPDGNVWVTGRTGSESFPIVGGLDDTLTGFTDAFVMKLDPIDGSILYSTYLGGDYVDYGYAITTNDAGEVIVVGSTISTDFPTTPDAYQGEPSAPLYVYSDVFITKFSASGDAILYSTYFGGYQDDMPEGVALDEQGNIVFAGRTDADDFPLMNPIQSDPNSMFVSKLSADGSTLLFSTYFGGPDSEPMWAMALGPNGDAYITGSTRSVDYPTTAGAFQEEFVGGIDECEEGYPPHPVNCDDVFVTRMGTDGSGVIYSTFLAGTDIEQPRDISVDAQGRAHIVGYTFSDDFPPDGIDFSAEIFVSRLSADGSWLDYSYTVDSGSANAGHGVAVDNAGGVYFTGAVNVPADIYVAKLQGDSPVPNVAVSISSTMTQVPRNSNFRFDVQVTNNEATPLTLTGWTAGQRVPGGTIFEPLIGPFVITLEAGETRYFNNVPQFVGNNIPLGDYRYYVRIGEDFPGPVWAEDSWDIEVIP